MIKTTLPWRNPVADSLAYSKKNTGFYRSDRSINAGTVSAERFIAPPDLIAQLAKDQNFVFNHDASVCLKEDGPKISTMPMPTLMKLLEYPHRDKVDFGYYPGVNVRAHLASTDAYVSVVVPCPSYPFSRVSITGDELIIECPGMNEELPYETQKWILDRALDILGYPLDLASGVTSKRQTYAKILNIPEGIRRHFIYWATQEHRVYSLGRFATWRPGLLLDDLVNDINQIDKWQDDDYSRVMKR
jgi:hypothetical protein